MFFFVGDRSSAVVPKELEKMMTKFDITARGTSRREANSGRFVSDYEDEKSYSCSCIPISFSSNASKAEKLRKILQRMMTEGLLTSDQFSLLTAGNTLSDLVPCLYRALTRRGVPNETRLVQIDNFLRHRYGEQGAAESSARVSFGRGIVSAAQGEPDLGGSSGRGIVSDSYGGSIGSNAQEEPYSVEDLYSYGGSIVQS